MQKFTIANGVLGSFIENSRFKNSLITVSFYIKPKAEEISAFSLVPSLMGCGCEEYPNFTLLNRKLDNLYGADIIKSTAMCGDFRVYSLSLKTVDDEFSESGNLEESAKLLSELCFGYFLSGKYCEDKDLEREKRILKEKIASALNEKRIYASEKLKGIMCQNEPYGLAISGTEELVDKIDKETIKSAFGRLIENAMINIQFCGKKLPNGFFEIFKDKFSKIERSPIGDFEQIIKAANKENTVTEEMDVNQGKLVMGFRSNGILNKETIAANIIMSDIFGGGTYSKLFMNVREKLSLCYYCSSNFNRYKNILTVSSGVEKSNIEKAKSEILNQFNMMKKGEFSDEVIENSKTSIITSCNAVLDDLGSHAKWYLNRLSEQDPLTPEEFANSIKNVTKEQIIESARSFNLDTTFILSPKEEN